MPTARDAVFEEASRKVASAMAAAGDSPKLIKEAQQGLKVVNEARSSDYKNADLLAAAIRYALAQRDGRKELSLQRLASEHGVHAPNLTKVAQQLSDLLGLRPVTLTPFLARDYGVEAGDDEESVTVQLPMPKTGREARMMRRLMEMCREDEAAENPLHERNPFKGDPTQIVFRFRVTLEGYSDLWRDLELRGDQTLGDLQIAIQKDFKWDNDHLWCFYMDCTKPHMRSKDRGAVYGVSEDDMPADEAKLADFALRTRRKFIYFFDFGDSHWFVVEVKATGKPEPRGKYPRVVEQHGKAPKQYQSEW